MLCQFTRRSESRARRGGLGWFFPMDEVCGVSVLSSFEGHIFRFWGKAFGQTKGETGREVLGWIFLFLLTTHNTNAFRPQATAFLSLFSRTSFVTRALLSWLSISLSISVDGARGGGEGHVGKASDVFMVSGQATSLPSNCLAGEPAATCKIALNDGQASICWETSFGPALFLFSSLFSWSSSKTGSFS